MHALTFVLNPKARKPRLRPPSAEELRLKLGENAEVYVTQSLDELDELMRSWQDHRDRTLCFYGGDGSIARGLTSLIRHKGENFNFPPLLALRAGTINMMCSVLGIREAPEKTIECWSRGEILAQREIPTLKVEVGSETPMYGFVFAWGVGYRVLRGYYGRAANGAPSIKDAAASFGSTFLQALHPMSEKTELFKLCDLKLRVNGECCAEEARFRALTVGTIPRVSLGMRPFPKARDGRQGVAFSANGLPAPEIALKSPWLVFGLSDQREIADGKRLVCGANARELVFEADEGFTMDGEMFELQGPTKIRITQGPAIRFWMK